MREARSRDVTRSRSLSRELFAGRSAPSSPSRCQTNDALGEWRSIGDVDQRAGHGCGRSARRGRAQGRRCRTGFITQTFAPVIIQRGPATTRCRSPTSRSGSRDLDVLCSSLARRLIRSGKEIEMQLRRPTRRE